MVSASMLTYSTLLAVVPVVAVIFAIARGFGYNKYIETWFRQVLSSQPDVADVILGFVNSYLIHTKSGVVLGIGLLFMLYSIIMLTRNIEMTFNDIWNVKSPRGLMRTFTDYLAMFFILPILIIIVSGVTVWMGSLSKMVGEAIIIGPLFKFLINYVPLLILAVILTILYVFMPNTHVKWKTAILPGIGAACCMEMLQYFYVHSQIWMSSYNAIYGSFAALPLFMLWLQFTWIIILIGAELSYTLQNVEMFVKDSDVRELSHKHRMMLSAMLMSLICKRFKNGQKPYTIFELKQELGIPMRMVSDLIYDLQKAKMICELGAGKDFDAMYQPAESIENLTVGLMLSRLDSLNPWPFDADFIPDSAKWRRTMLMRKNYLRAQKDIKLYEL